MIPKRLRSLAFVLVAVLFLGVGLAACGDDDDSAATTTTAAEEEEETTTTTEAEQFDPDEGDEGENQADEDQQEAIDEFTSGLEDELDTETADEGYTFETVEDETGQLVVSIPTEWSDRELGESSATGGPQIFGPQIIASTDVASYNEGFEVPGMQFVATDDSTTGDPNAILDELDRIVEQACDDSVRQPYSDTVFTGISETFENCGNTGASFVWVAAEPADESFVSVVGVQVLSDADIEALNEILGSFNVFPAG